MVSTAFKLCPNYTLWHRRRFVTKILVIDNDELIRCSLTFLLQTLGYSVQSLPFTSSTVESLSQCSNHSFICLIDGILPDQNTYHLLMTASASPILKQHTYILLSTNDQAEKPLLKAIERELHLLIIKYPFESQQLKQAIDEQESVRGGKERASL